MPGLRWKQSCPNILVGASAGQKLAVRPNHTRRWALLLGGAEALWQSYQHLSRQQNWLPFLFVSLLIPS